MYWYHEKMQESTQKRENGATDSYLARPKPKPKKKGALWFLCESRKRKNTICRSMEFGGTERNISQGLVVVAVGRNSVWVPRALHICTYFRSPCRLGKICCEACPSRLVASGGGLSGGCKASRQQARSSVLTISVRFVRCRRPNRCGLLQRVG